MLPKTISKRLRYHLVLTSCAVALILAASPAATAGPHTYKLPAHAVQIANGVFSLGTAMHRGREVSGIAFVHPRYNRARPDNPGGGKGGGGGGGGDTTTTSSCYTLIAKGARWRAVENYLLDTSNLSGMTETFVTQQLDTAVTSWNEQLSDPVFGTRIVGVVDGADHDTPDNKNEVYFAEITDPNVIAVTIVWGNFGGPPRSREVVEWDQVYDDVEFTWADADTNTSAMDMLNIAVHEVGHAAGMGHPDLTCNDETMHAYAEEGETKKRDLNAGDITGIKELYK